MKKSVCVLWLAGSMVLGVTACGTYEPTATKGEIASGQAVSGCSVKGQGEEKETGFTNFKTGNSTNCYATYDRDNDEKEEFAPSTDLLQFDLQKKVSAEIDTGLEDMIEIEKVTEREIFCISYDHEDDNEKEFLYRIPIKKTEGNDIVLVEEKELLAGPMTCIYDISVRYADDNCVVYSCTDAENERWYRYEIGTKKTMELQGVPASRLFVQWIGGTQLGAYFLRQSDEGKQEYYYYDEEKNNLCRADLGEFFYNHKYSFIHQIDKKIYFNEEEVWNPYYEGISTLKQYDMNSNQTKDWITKQQWISFLQEGNYWEKGMTVRVQDVMGGDGQIYVNVRLEKTDKKNVTHCNDIIVSCNSTGEPKLQYETKLNDRIKDKGDKEIYESRYKAKSMHEDGYVSFIYYPYVEIYSVDSDSYIYNIKTEEKWEIKEEEGDWAYQLSYLEF